MIRVVFLVVLVCCLCVRVGAEEPAFFADPVLKEAVEAALWTPDPTPTDMLNLRNLACCAKEIDDITGLEYAVNLQDLTLRWNKIRDLSPLSGLVYLESLDVSRNRAPVLSPLSGLANLRYLNLHDNDISDVSPLAGLTHLQTLILRENAITDISPLASLTDLRELDLLDNQISDISPLLSLDSLEALDLRVNPLSRESCQVYIPQIVVNNPGISFDTAVCVSWVVSVASTIGGSVISPGEAAFTYANGDDVRLIAEADPGFTFVGWSGSYCSSQNPTIVTVSQDHHIRANFLSALDVICVDDDAAGDPGPGDPEASDPQENGTAAHPFDSIQEAIEVAADGASIVVRPGVYRENIDFLGKSIQLVGIDPNDPNDASFPVLDGLGDGPVVTFTNGEDSNCVLMGFVITRGQGDPAGAIYCEGSRPTVANCLIVGNRGLGLTGAAVSCVNSAAAFVNCTLADNVGGAEGGGIIARDSDVIVTNSILWGNVPAEVVVRGASAPSITYTDVTGGWPGVGNLDVDPLFVRHGRWTDPQDPNTAVSPYDAGALWLEGDYHLQSQAGRWHGAMQAWVLDELTSLCIDAGDPVAPVGVEPAPNGGVVNAGAYGGTRQSSQSPLFYEEGVGAIPK